MIAMTVVSLTSERTVVAIVPAALVVPGSSLPSLVAVAVVPLVLPTDVVPVTLLVVGSGVGNGVGGGVGIGVGCAVGHWPAVLMGSDDSAGHASEANRHAPLNTVPSVHHLQSITALVHCEHTETAAGGETEKDTAENKRKHKQE